MTTEEKAKAYDEALERAKAYHRNELSETRKEITEYIFPELREFNEEEIRKDIIGGLMWQRDNLKSEGPHDNNLILPGFCFTVGEHLSYLEKQKEQKPYEPHNWPADKDNLTQEQKPVGNPFDANETMKMKDRIDEGFTKMMLAEQKPAEWSDTKELIFKDICNHLEVEGYGGWVVLLEALRNGEFQPKQEWSEKDKKLIDDVINSLCCYFIILH